MIKKLNLLVCVLLLIPTLTFAADYSKPLTFGWEQNLEDLPSLEKWGLYVMTSSNGTKDTIIDVPYTTGAGPFQASSTFTVTGVPGSTIRRYFVLDAVSKNGDRSEFSNEVFYDFIIPFSNVTTPMSLTVTALVMPQ